MTINENLTPSAKANLLSSTSQAAMLVHDIMDKLATLNIPENPERTPEQTAIIKEHF
jgi:hypothetical protein